MFRTNKGYNRSVIFSLFANSNARSNGILHSLAGLIQFDQETYHTPFKCMGPIFTTWRIFSLFRMPSRRPLVIPATLSSFVPLIMELSALVSLPITSSGYIRRTFSPGNAHALGFHLITKTPFILPESGRDTGLRSRGSHLTGRVIDVALQRRSGVVAVSRRRHAMASDCKWLDGILTGWRANLPGNGSN